MTLIKTLYEHTLDNLLLARQTLAVVSLISVFGCTTTIQKPPMVTSLPAPTGKIDVRLKPALGQVEQAEQCAVTSTSFLEGGELRRKRIEKVDFTTEVKTQTATGLFPDTKYTQVVSVLKKMGPTPLHDLGFPELGEEIAYELNSKGVISKAGAYPADSIFFIPAVPLAQKPVTVGEVWESNFKWKGQGSALPMEAKLISKVIGFEKCGTQSCMRVELEGNILIPQAVAKLNQFQHSLKGQYLMDHSNGLLVAADFSAQESIEEASPSEKREKVKVLISSRTVSQLVGGKNLAGSYLPNSFAKCPLPETP